MKAGRIVEIATLAPPEESRVKAVKVPPSLEFPTQEIIVLRSDRNEDRTESALVFVPDDARTFLRERIEAYGRDPGNRRRPDVDRFEAMETVRAAAPEALFVGAVDFDASVRLWWEIWVREPAVRTDQLATLARVANFDVHADRLTFPETTVLFIHAAARPLAEFISRVPGAVSEVRRATGTIEPFLERDRGGLGQHDWVAELATRVVAPQGRVPAVCTLDTGISAAHPLIVPGLQGAWAYDAAWGTHDHVPDGGHGTALASLALYGDLESLMNGGGPVQLTHAVESMKLLPPQGFPATQPPSYGVVTQGAVASVETARPDTLRSYCLAVSATDFSPERPSSWSGSLDQIASGSMPGDVTDGVSAADSPKRLVLVATGNVLEGMMVNVLSSQPLEDPAQSWNALSIGGFTRKEQSPAPPPVLSPVVAANNRSPFSRGSQSLPDDLTPIKPEVLFEAGNMLSDESGFCGWGPSVSLLAAGADIASEPLVSFWATSAATGMAGQFVGQLQTALPQLWPETHRALTVDSADWPEPIRRKFIGRGAHWKTGSKREKQKLLREFGYGVPDIERAILSARNDMTLIAEAEIQPYAFGADGKTVVFNEVHFYELPWPRTALEMLENEIVTMKVTLSYFVEPNLTGRAATRPDTYRSFGLRFEMKKRTETKAKFRSRLSASQQDDASEAGSESNRWLLGSKAVQAGSLHCDLWRGRAIELAGHDAIAVYPVGGWWKSHIGQRRATNKARYALTMSIAAPGQPVDLHTEVVNLVQVRAIEVSID
jgi:hypothetical protein